MFDTSADGLLEYRSEGRAGRVFFGSGWVEQWKLDPMHLSMRHDIAVITMEQKQRMLANPAGYLGSKKNPYVICVLSLGSPQTLLYWNKQVRLKAQHDWVCIDVLSGRVWESDTPTGDIAIRDNRFSQENIRGHCLQSFVADRGCGLAPVNDDWGLEPPEDGYKQQLCGDRDWTGGIGVAVYYRLQVGAEGQCVYGRLVLKGSGRAWDSLLECYTNLEGRQNLYFKGYEESATTVGPAHIKDYVSPPVNPDELKITPWDDGLRLHRGGGTGRGGPGSGGREKSQGQILKCHIA